MGGVGKGINLGGKVGFSEGEKSGRTRVRKDLLTGDIKVMRELHIAA